MLDVFEILDAELTGYASLRALDEAAFEQLMREQSHASGHHFHELPRRKALLRDMEELKHGHHKLSAADKVVKTKAKQHKRAKEALEAPHDHAGMLALMQQKYG